MLRYGFILFVGSLILWPGALAGDETISGSFQRKDIKVTGSFTIEKVDGKTVLSLGSDFKTKSGPDLQIVFSPMPFAKVNGKNALDGGAVSIGELKSNKGAQTYEIPANVDLSKMKCVLIHCVKYSKLWGGGPLR